MGYFKAWYKLEKLFILKWQQIYCKIVLIRIKNKPQAELIQEKAK